MASFIPSAGRMSVVASLIRISFAVSAGALFDETQFRSNLGRELVQVSFILQRFWRFSIVEFDIL
jgi:hypothetical protein